MSCYLIIFYRKHYVFYRTLYNCPNQIHQVQQHTYFISCFLIQMKPVCDAFLDLFLKLFSLIFFLNCDYIFCLTCKSNQKNYERAESEETKKDKKNNIHYQKRICKGSFIYDVRRKSKARTPTPFFPSMHKHQILI